jgi:hypothetical protein
MSRPSIKYVAGWMASILAALFLAFPSMQERKRATRGIFSLGPMAGCPARKEPLQPSRDCRRQTSTSIFMMTSLVTLTVPSP